MNWLALSDAIYRAVKLIFWVGRLNSTKRTKDLKLKEGAGIENCHPSIRVDKR